MVEHYSDSNDDRHTRQRMSATDHETGSVESSISENAAVPSVSLAAIMGDSPGVQANAPVRAATMQIAQQTHGNRAVQRVTQQGNKVAVQRSLWDDATSWVGRTASSAASSISNTASDIAAHPLQSLATAATYANPAALPFVAAQQVAHGASALFGERQNVAPTGSGQAPTHSHSLFEQGIDWAEHQGSRLSHDAADMVSGVPVLGSVAQAGANVADQMQQVTGGALRAAGGMVGGVANMVEHPVDTAIGLERMGENIGPPGFLNPLRAAHGAYDVVAGNRSIGDSAHHWLNPIESQRQNGEFFGNMIMGAQDEHGHRSGGMIDPYREAWQHGRYGEMVGRLGVDVGSFFMGGGEAGAAGRIGEAGRAAELARGAEVAGNASPGAEVVAQLGHGGEAAADVGRASRGADAAGAARGVTPQPVRQMPAVPMDIAPNAPQPGRWNAGPVGTPPISNPVMEMPAVTHSQAASGQLPRDWGTYSVGRGRLPGEVGEMPAVAANPGAHAPAGFGSSSGRVSPRSLAPLAPPSSVSIDPLARTAEMQAAVDPLARTAAMPRTVDPLAQTAEIPAAVNPLGPTVEMPSHAPVAYFPTDPAIPAVRRPTLPGIGPGGGRPTLPGIGAVDPLPYAPTAEMPAAMQRGGGTGRGPVVNSNEIAAANEGSHVPVEFDPQSGRYTPGGPSEGGFGPQGINRMPGFIKDLDRLGEYDVMKQVLRGHEINPSEYLQQLHRNIGE